MLTVQNSRVRLLWLLGLVLSLTLGVACKKDKKDSKDTKAPTVADAAAKAPPKTPADAAPAAKDDDDKDDDKDDDDKDDDKGDKGDDKGDKGDKDDDHKGASKANEKPKNLKLLPKSWSRKQVVRVMKKFEKSLGVECEFCHKDKNYASDDNKHKKTARMMMRMTGDLNKKFFGGKGKVSCYTCHQGKKEP
jgi:hypothetical protein